MILIVGLFLLLFMPKNEASNKQKDVLKEVEKHSEILKQKAEDYRKFKKEVVKEKANS